MNAQLLRKAISDQRLFALLLSKGLGDQPGLEAVLYDARGTQQVLDILFERGVSADAVHDGRSVLFRAVIDGEIDFARVLLARGANADFISNSEQGNTPLLAAVAIKSLPLVTLLTDFGASCKAVDEDRRTPLINSVRRQYFEMVRQVLSHDEEIVDVANKDGYTALHYAGVGGTPEIVEAIIGKLSDEKRDIRSHGSEGGKTALHLACENGNHKAVQALLDGGADISICGSGTEFLGWNALDFAITKHHLECAKILLERGLELHGRPSEDVSLMQRAIESKTDDMINLVLAHHPPASESCRCFTREALGSALRTENPFAVDLLFKQAMDVNTIVTHTGWTALHWAIRRNNADIVSVILRHGAEVDQADWDG